MSIIFEAWVHLSCISSRNNVFSIFNLKRPGIDAQFALNGFLEVQVVSRWQVILIAQVVRDLLSKILVTAIIQINFTVI